MVHNDSNLASQDEFLFNIYNKENIPAPYVRSFKIIGQPTDREETIPNLEVNNVYYAMYDLSLIAFKVLAVIFGTTTNCQVSFQIYTADGKILRLNGKDLFFKHCFKSIENYRKYQRTLNKDCEVERVYSYHYIMPFLNGNTPLKQLICNGKHMVTIPTFTIDYETNNVVEVASRFEALWIDSDGLHFIAKAEKKEYFSYEECEQSVPIIDFEESEKPQKAEMTEVNISIKIPAYAKDEFNKTIMAFSTMALVNK